MPEPIKDYATGKTVRSTPEESVRQQFEHILIDELSYPKEHIDINFPIQRGSRRRAEFLDLVVFRSSKHKQDNIQIVIETEAPGDPYDFQLSSYATATTAEFAIWFDGLVRDRSRGAIYKWRDLARAPTHFLDIPALPHFGESLHEIRTYKKHQLLPAKSLKGHFQRMHNRLYGAGPIKREDAIAQEVIKVLFCKLYDELYTPGDTCEFRATVAELNSDAGRTAIANRLRRIFASLQSDPAFAEMFGSESINYDDEWIAYIVSELQRFALTSDETDTDAMGDAYEIFVGPQLKGESGQFFTPRAVVRLAVDMLAPSLVAREEVIDPACGSGGFLIYSLRHARREAMNHFRHDSESRIGERVSEYARNFVAGIDVDDLLHKVAKSYMAIVGNGRGGIFRDDALQPQDA